MCQETADSRVPLRDPSLYLLIPSVCDFYSEVRSERLVHPPSLRGQDAVELPAELAGDHTMATACVRKEPAKDRSEMSADGARRGVQHGVCCACISTTSRS